MQGLYCFL